MNNQKKGVRPTSKGPKGSNGSINHKPSSLNTRHSTLDKIAFEFDNHVASDFAVVVMMNNEKVSELLAPHCAKLGSLDRMDDFMHCVGLMLAVGKSMRNRMKPRCKDDKVLIKCINLAEQVSHILNLNRYGEY